MKEPDKRHAPTLRDCMYGQAVGDALGVPEDEIRSGGYVLDTERAALWCLANTSTYADCVLEAVNLGDDTATTAAVAGGLAGIVYGIGGIPHG